MEQNTINNNLNPSIVHSPIPKPYEHPKFTRCLAAAFLFALAVNILLYNFLKGTGLGLNALLTVIIFQSARAITLPSFDIKNASNWLLLPLILFHSLSFMFFNNGFLLFLNLIAVIALCAIQLALASGYCDAKRNSSIFREAIHNIFAKPFCAIGYFFCGLFKNPRTGSRSNIIGVTLGIAATFIVVIPVVALLSSADAVFSSIIKKIFSFESIGEIIGRIIVFIIVLIFSGSIFTASLIKRTPSPAKNKSRARLNIISVYIISIALALPLLAFSAIQVIYLFGANPLPDGMSFSSYARSGFFQLCAASVIVFAVIAIGIALTSHANRHDKLFLNILFTLLSFSTVMLLISAFWRMCMYESAYGYTRLRIYVQAFIIVLGVITLFVTAFIWLRNIPLTKIIFLFCTISLLGLTYFNTDAFIARNNDITTPAASAYNSSSKDGVDYLLSLSPDALPEYAHKLRLEDFEYIEGEYNEENYKALYRREALAGMYCYIKQDNILSYNVNRKRAELCLEDLMQKGFFNIDDNSYYY